MIAAGALLLMLACNLFAPRPGADKDQLSTQIAQTMVAQLTQVAGTTATAAPTGTPAPTATEVASQTPFPSATPLPTSTPWPTPTPTVCNRARFVGDVDVPDGAVLPAGSSFVKIWRLQNTGTCTWTTAYTLFFVSGNRMGAGSLIGLPHSVLPGGYVDIAVPMVAPQEPGRYLGNWQLRSPAGELFGIGSAANRVFWVEIKVVDFGLSHYYDLVDHICEAKWRNQDGPIPCWGPVTDKAGFVQLVEAPHFEDGRIDDEPAMWVHPPFGQDGWISGEFPAVQIRRGDEFRTHIGCFYGNDACEVTFRLDYRKENGIVHTLGTWTQIYDQEISKVEVDLTELAGQKISLILVVKARGSHAGDNVFWFAPYINGLITTATEGSS
jgi:hypothetical protein